MHTCNLMTVLLECIDLLLFLVTKTLPIGLCLMFLAIYYAQNAGIIGGFPL